MKYHHSEKKCACDCEGENSCRWGCISFSSAPCTWFGSQICCDTEMTPDYVRALVFMLGLAVHFACSFLLQMTIDIVRFFWSMILWSLNNFKLRKIITEPESKIMTHVAVQQSWKKIVTGWLARSPIVCMRSSMNARSQGSVSVSCKV